MQNPVKQLKRNGFIALAVVTLLYLFANVAYFSAGKQARVIPNTHLFHQD
jgi:hypothetical protein